MTNEELLRPKLKLSWQNEYAEDGVVSKSVALKLMDAARSDERETLIKEVKDDAVFKEKICQIISSDLSGNEKVDWLMSFLASREQQHKEEYKTILDGRNAAWDEIGALKVTHEKELEEFGKYLYGDAFTENTISLFRASKEKGIGND